MSDRAMPDLWGQAEIAMTLLLYLGVLTGSGLVVVRMMFAHVLHAVDARIRLWAGAFASLGIVASLLGFSLRAAALTGDASGMTDPAMLGLLWQTPVGVALMLRVTGLALLLAGLALGRHGLWVALAGAVLSLWSFTSIGHVSDGGLLWLKLLLLLHLLGVALWIGVLSPLKHLASDPERFDLAAALGHRFGRVAAVLVPVLLVAGATLAWRLVGSTRNLVGTGYGLVLLAKIAVVSLLLGLAAANKVRFVPAMQAGDRAAARHLTRSISLEWVAVIAVLLATATLTSVLTVPA